MEGKPAKPQPPSHQEKDQSSEEGIQRKVRPGPSMGHREDPGWSGLGQASTGIRPCLLVLLQLVLQQRGTSLQRSDRSLQQRCDVGKDKRQLEVMGRDLI